MNKHLIPYVLIFLIGIPGVSFAMDNHYISERSQKNGVQAIERMPFVRPDCIQKMVDEAFKKLKNTNMSWSFDGREALFYNKLGLDEAQIIRDIARDADKKDIYLIDVGAGAGGWGAAAATFIKRELRRSNKHFHIVSLTGDCELADKVIKDGNVTCYEYGNFKIEDIDAELAKRFDVDLTNNVDLIVSRWTLRHLIDPIGTVKRLYKLLTPKNGMMISDGFFLKLNNATAASGICKGSGYWKILADSSARSLFLAKSVDREVDDFILIKQGDRPLEVPVDYTGETHCVGSKDQGTPHPVCVFKSASSLEGIPTFEERVVFDERNRIIGQYYGDEQARKLYKEIVHKHWIKYDND